MSSDRVRAEQRRLRGIARAAGLDDESMWYDACYAADLSGRVDVTPLTVMRHMLDDLGIIHEAHDGFGTAAPQERSA